MEKIENYLEHTLLKPEATVDDIIALCKTARKYNFKAVCVNPCYVDLAKHVLTNSSVKVVAVIGFPLGANFTEVKVIEAKMAVNRLADEVDMVMNLAAFKSGNLECVVKDIKAVVEAAKPSLVKVIIETCLLTDAEKRTATKLVAKGGASFVKTSTGFNKGGATVYDVKILREEADKYGLGVKAAGGIRDLKTAKELIEAGANRIGTSAGDKICQEVN